MDFVSDIKKLKCGKTLENVDLKKYNTYRVGGVGRLLVIPKNENGLISLLNYIKKNNIKYKVIGNGSNLIFNDDIYEGVLIKLDEFETLKIDGTTINVGSGYSLARLAVKMSKLGLTGLEFAAGIPGTIGGAVYMNAGAYNSDMGYIVRRVNVLTPNLTIKTLSNSEMNFHYRTSFLQENKDNICLGCTIKLKKGNKDNIINVLNDRKKRRFESQPLEFPNAGSVFRNPPGDYAGRLIEELGYKGKNVGGAKVSEKHANFIINYNNASGSDVKKLINEIKDKVKKEFGIDLKVEQEFVE